MTSTSTIDKLREDFRGALIQPEDASYEEVRSLYNAMIDKRPALIARCANELSLMHLYPIDGAVHRVGEKDTAWSTRDATWSMVIAGIDPDPANARAVKAWAKAYWEAVHPFAAQGAYINFMMEEGEDRIKASYGDNYDLLVKIKTKYDPSNRFRVNQNIKPSA